MVSILLSYGLFGDGRLGVKTGNIDVNKSARIHTVKQVNQYNVKECLGGWVDFATLNCVSGKGH